MTHTESIDDLTVTVYAPDWIWQKGAVNILVTIKNSGPREESIDLLLSPPESNADHFAIGPDAKEKITLIVPAGESIRYAFTNIIALGDVERQTYDFSIDTTTDSHSRTIAYSLTTIRGPVVNTAQWAMFLPAILCAAWCIVFVIVLRRYTEPGAWKTSSHLELGESETDSAT